MHPVIISLKIRLLSLFLNLNKWHFYRNTSTIRYATLAQSAEEQEENEDDISNLITEEGNVLTNPDGGYNREPRQHKISIMSTDSEYTNTTDMTMQTTIPYQPKMHFDDDDEGTYEERDSNTIFISLRYFFWQII